MSSPTFPAPEAAELRQRLLKALAANRAPGFHLPGYFLELSWPKLDEQPVQQAMSAGPYYCDARGAVHPAPLGVMIDGALSTAQRLGVGTGARTATVQLHVQYTGRPATGELNMEARLEGFVEGNAVRQAIVRGVLRSDGEPVCYATGAWVTLPAPPDATLAPLPWQKGDEAPPPLDAKELDVKERGVMRAAQTALRGQDAEHSFIERFWGIMPKHTATGATCRVKIGPQIGNRVGHVQGGVLLGIAEATASAAVPGHQSVSNISAWYISPGQGKALGVRSKVIHAGRSFAIVRTEVKNADGTLVLAAVSNHAARKSP